MAEQNFLIGDLGRIRVIHRVDQEIPFAIIAAQFGDEENPGVGRGFEIDLLRHRIIGNVMFDEKALFGLIAEQIREWAQKAEGPEQKEQLIDQEDADAAQEHLALARPVKEKHARIRISSVRNQVFLKNLVSRISRRPEIS